MEEEEVEEEVEEMEEEMEEMEEEEMEEEMEEEEMEKEMEEVEEEMETLLSARRLEQRVMNAMPFLIVWYVEAGNPGYFNMLYGNLPGIVLMTVCMGVYLLAYVLSEWIFEKTFEER